MGYYRPDNEPTISAVVMGLVVLIIALLLLGAGCGLPKGFQVEVQLTNSTTTYYHIKGFTNDENGGGCNYYSYMPCVYPKWTDDKDEIRYWNELKCYRKELVDYNLTEKAEKECKELYDKLYNGDLFAKKLFEERLNAIKDPDEREYTRLHCKSILESQPCKMKGDYKWVISTINFDSALDKLSFYNHKGLGTKVIRGGQGYLGCVELSKEELKTKERCKELKETLK